MAAALDGRLGGTRQSFEARYGMPIGMGPSGIQYRVAGYGLVALQTELTGGAAARVLIIILRSPRPATVPATTSNPADWSLAKARELALRFLPADVTLGAERQTDANDRAASCTSAALGVVFGPAGNACQIGFVMPTPRTVSFVTLTLGTGGAATAVANVLPCAGLAPWAQATGKRLQTAARLLTAVGKLNETDPTAPANLRQMSDQFATLATDQGSGAIPAAANATNGQLVAAFGRYRDALALSATGLEQHDRQAEERAAAMIADANAAVADASERLQAVLFQCGVPVATPAPAA